MTAGLPGTGLGGLLYLMLVVLMPIREFWLLLTGRSSVARWKTVGQLFAMGAAIVLSIWGEGWLLAKGLEWLANNSTANSFLHMSSLVGMRTVVPSMALAPFVVLGALILAMHAVRLVLRHRRKNVAIEFNRPPTKLDSPSSAPAAEAA